jgi:TM2 domain-containing membrane protein YozV
MKPTLKAGLLLGILVVVWMLVTGVTGWYKDPAMRSMFYIVVLIEIVVLIWGLRLTAKEGKTYGGQIGAGTMMAIIGAVIIFFASILFTTVLYPNYFAEAREASLQALVAKGMTADQAEVQLKMMDPMETPLVQALIGAVMTVVTGFVASLVIAAVLRKKPAAQA